MKMLTAEMPWKSSGVKKFLRTSQDPCVGELLVNVTKEQVKHCRRREMFGLFDTQYLVGDIPYLMKMKELKLKTTVGCSRGLDGLTRPMW